MYLDKGLNALLASASLPAYSIPFNIAITILLLCLHEPPTQSLFLSYTIHDANTTQEVEWEKS
ncbi:hypothetical protein SK128_018282 [Halocaridina rubra]|uniref:Uncharacterized protein n=1 Tax=Halocaridina rubra TaxID=373956 RepID=A0AAN9AAU4_HALRR